MTKKLFNAVLLAGLALLSGCVSYAELVGSPVDNPGSPVIERQMVTVDADPKILHNPPSLEAQRTYASETSSKAYKVGCTDVLLINISGQEDLNIWDDDDPVGNRVDGDGYISLPYIGRIHVAGLTLAQIEDRLVKVFSEYLVDPWVTVEILEYKSHPVHFLGQFNQPGTYYLDRQYSLLAGMSLAGGLRDDANLRGARLIRDNRTLPVDIYQLLKQGASNQNIALRRGDTLFVPDDKNQHVYVFGAVNRPGSVSMPNGELNLAQALASADLDESLSNTREIRIIRSLSQTRGELIVVNNDQAMSGNALAFNLLEGDIVYVPRSTIGNWNQVIQDILPSLQAVSAFLQPFVSIKYLQDDD